MSSAGSSPRARAVLALLAAALGLALLVPGPAAASRTGFWKLNLTVDYTSEGSASDRQCYPDPEQEATSTVTGSSRQKVTVRTTTATTIEAHEAPNGVPVVQEALYGKAFRGRVSEERQGDIGAGGEPLGCNGAKPRTDCGTRSVVSGLYLNPLGGIHSWRGFVLELQSSPDSGFQRCGVTEAQGKLPSPLTIEVEAPRGKLLGGSRRLIFSKTVPLKASANAESRRSTATGTLRYTVTLTRTSGY